ncbi:hypothetical protein Leryth_003110 [Lithospermum erythrorhizon]|nr:hypothetical protein Leryth_003110 [Lithospermum erythrorhizon]
MEVKPGDVAVEIVLKKEANEATSLFIQGMHPVVDVKEITGRDEQVEELLNKDKHADQTTPIGTSCQCSCPSAQRESPTYQSNKLKEPVSAHF